MSDSILRKHRDENFKTIYLKVLNEEEDLSWKAKGLHTYLMTRPDNWKFNYQDIINRASDGRTAVESGMKELKDKGYLKIINRQSEEGKWTSEWIVSEEEELLEEELTDADFRGTENPCTDNRHSSSTVSSSTVDNNKTEQSSLTDKLDYADPTKHTPKDLVIIFNHTLDEEQSFVRKTRNWQKDIGIMSNVRKKFDGDSAQTREFLEWVVKHRFDDLKKKNTNMDNLGFLFAYVNDFLNWRKQQEQEKATAEHIDAGAPDPVEGVESMDEVRSIMEA
ncbi:hypothetical protein KGY79_13840 [Candidatus Bipolaricaulota bacterium]|nr:hypothetical protein [Candidatus Bipolaricaulota bacterium]